MKAFVFFIFSIFLLPILTLATAENAEPKMYLYSCEPIRGSQTDTPIIQLTLIQDENSKRHVVLKSPELPAPYTMAPDRRRRLPGITRERFGDRANYIIVSQVMFGEGIRFWDSRRGGFAEVGRELGGSRRIDHYNCYSKQD